MVSWIQNLDLLWQPKGTQGQETGGCIGLLSGLRLFFLYFYNLQGPIMSMSNVKVNRSSNMQIRISKQNDHVLSCFRHFLWPPNLSFF